MKRISLFFILLFLISCSDDNLNDSVNETEVNSYIEADEIEDNVLVISDSITNLLSNEIDLSNGIYKLEFLEKIPEPNTGDIIVGDIGNGFLRKVLNYSRNDNILTIETEQATLDDLFKDAEFNFISNFEVSRINQSNVKSSLQVKYLAQGVQTSEDGLIFDFSNTLLYEDGPISLKIANGKAIFNPNFQFKSEFTGFGGLEYLDFGMSNGSFAVDLDFALEASQELDLINYRRSLAKIEKRQLILFYIPVIVVYEIELFAEISANISSEFNLTKGYESKYIISTGLTFRNESWNSRFDSDYQLTSKPVQKNGEANFHQEFALVPKVSVRIYNVSGPYVDPQLKEVFDVNIASPSLDWDASMAIGFDLKAGIRAEIFGEELGDYSKNFQVTSVEVWNAPDHLEIISSIDPKGIENQALPEPLEIKVFDKLGNTLSNVPIYFKVTEGSGSIDPENILTDENGIANAIWTLGNSTEQQTVEVHARNADGTIIGSPIIINATAEENEDIGKSGRWEAYSYYHYGDFYYMGNTMQSNYNEECGIYVEQDKENYFVLSIPDELRVGNYIGYNWSHSNRRADDYNYVECSDIIFGSFDTWEYDEPFRITEIVNSNYIIGWMDDERIEIIFNDDDSMTLYVDRNSDDTMYKFNFAKQ